MLMKTLCIYGTGGMGREIAELADRLAKWKQIVFIDDVFTCKMIDEIEVFSLEEVLKEYDSDSIEFIVATGEPVTREAIYNKLNKSNVNCISIIHPEFILSKHSSVDIGTIIHVGALATCNVHIGYGCLINKHTVIGHDVSIGQYSVLSPNVTVGGDVNIGNKCFLGSGSIVKNGICIAENSIIGMGAVVLNDVPPNSVVVGNPAKFLRENLDGRVFYDKRNKPEKNRLLIIGASGNGRVSANIAAAMNRWQHISFLDDNDSINMSYNAEVIGKTCEVKSYINEFDIFVAIGNNDTRMKIQGNLEKEGASIPILIHPSAVIGQGVVIGIGTVIMPGVVINSFSKIGKGCIINTGATIDHDNVIEDYVHISPGVHLAGTVKVGNGSWIGIGSVIINNIDIISNCTIGAGTVVIRDITEVGTYVGVPARKIISDKNSHI